MNKKIICLVFCLCMINGVFAKEADKESVSLTAEDVLLKAHQTLEEAETLADALIAQAKIEADAIHHSVVVPANAESLEFLKNELVAIDARDMTIENLVQSILPEGWRVLVEADEKIKNQRLDFIAQKSRDAILQDLCVSLGLRYQYFDQIKDAGQQPSPILVISAQ